MRGAFFIGFALLLIVAGCSRKTTSLTTTTNTFDSTWTKELPRIAEIKLPGNKVVAWGKIHLDSVGRFIPVHIKAKDGEVYVDVHIDQEGNVKATGGYDSLKKLIEVKDKEINRLRKETTKETKTATVTEYKTRSFDIFCRWYFGITLLIAALVVYINFKRATIP